jgi:NADH-quinone oxidoreductase subunit L
VTTAHGIQSVAWLLIALPALSAAILLMAGRIADKWAHWVGALVPVALFGYAVALFFSIKGQSDRAVNLDMFNWIPVGGFRVEAGLLIDPLAMVFVLLITGVGSLIHIYAVGYLDHDPGRRRFFGYFNLFIAAMLLLVLSNNYLVLYVGWEGVGLSSYLLIAYYFNRDSAATAGNKAFFANRVGDVGLSLAIMLMFAYVGSTSFADVFGTSSQVGTGVATAISLLLILGACGKSGQFPLQTWLPDAMEGPTPVSALIHAATMVTAGVYLIARSAPLFDQSQAARTVVVIIGAITLLYGCICAFGQDDLKRVLAYSTVSQIGYMFLAVGLGPGVYAIGIIHLLGHGFFKAALFLSAGAVMHAMNDRIDMRRFGGLARVMPITFGVFACGYLAIIGIPPFTGFFTKDKIIEAAFDKGGTSGYVLGIAALLGAGLTAFYMTRALVMTFFGRRRWEDDVHPHEAKPVMTAPMVLLGLLSLVGGYLLIFGGGVQHWLEPSVGTSVEEGVRTISPVVLAVITVVVALLGVAGAVAAFRTVPAVQPVGSPVTVAVRRNLFADAFNETVLMRPGQWLTRLFVFLDNRGVDGLGASVGGGSSRLRRIQTGFVRSYALSMLVGSVAVVVVLLAVRFQ